MYRPSYRSTSGSIFAMLFGAVAIVGIIAVAANTLIRGPMSSMADVTRRTLVENSMIASSRLLVVMSATLQADNGDCDADGYVEPLPYRDAGALPKPAGGGYLPTTIGAALTDPWNTQYGYCVWDHGPKTTTDNIAACGGATPRRLKGGNANIHTTIAVISAGKDRVFQTTCNAFVDTNADNIPDTPLVNKPVASDDMVLSHSYAEAIDLGGGGESLWREKDAATADIDKDVELRASNDAVTARIEKETGFGLFNSIYVDNIYRRTAPRITVQDETMFNGNVGIGMIPDGHKLAIAGNGVRIDYSANYDVWIQGGPYSGVPAASRNLALVGNKATDTLYVNSGAEYSGGTRIGGPVYVENAQLYADDARIGIMYDRNNTGYYVDPNAISVMSQVNTTLLYANNPGNNHPIISVSAGPYYAVHATANGNGPAVYAVANNGGAAVLGISNGANYGLYGRTYSSLYGGVIGYSNNGYFGILGYADTWGIYTNGPIYSSSGTSYFPWIYDAQNTNYYWDGNGTSSFNAIVYWSIASQSDIRLKKNVKDLTSEQIENLYKLRGVSFDWKRDDKHDIGLIAQEVQKIYPELVHENKEGTLTVQYLNLVPILIETVKTQKTQIDALETRIAKIEAALQSQGGTQSPAASTKQSLPGGMMITPLERVDTTTIAGAKDISVCLKPVAPECLTQNGSGNGGMTCRAKMNEYIDAARIYWLCAHNNPAAIKTMETEYAATMDKATGKGFDVDGLAIDYITPLHVRALENILNGTTAPPADTDDT